MKITDYRVCPKKGIGLCGTDIQGGEVSEDGFVWCSTRSTNFADAVEAVKALKEGEEKRIKDNEKLMEGL